MQILLSKKRQQTKLNFYPFHLKSFFHHLVNYLFFYCCLFFAYVFIESSSIKAIGRKIATGIHAQNSGRTLSKMTSVASILQINVVIKQAVVRPKLIIIADFTDFGSRQTRIGRHTMSIARFIIGSVMRKCFWL